MKPWTSVVTSVAVVSTLVALLAPAPEAVGAVPVQTPVLPSTVTYWGPSGPVVGTSLGTLMGDGSVRSTSAPATRVSLAPDVRDLVLGTHASLTRGAGPTILVDDARAVGSKVTTAGSTTRSATLWALDLTTGATITRAVTDLPSSAGLVGSDGTSWVTAAASGPATRWPFDGSAPVVVDPPDLDRVLAVGDLGIVYLSAGDATLASRLLRLAPTHGRPSVTLADFAGAEVDPGALVAVTASGAVGWAYADRVGYWDAAHGTLLATGAAVPDVSRSVAVIPGAVSCYGQSAYGGPGWNDVWGSWAVTAGALAPVSARPSVTGSPAALWSSATSTGAPAFGLVDVRGVDTPALQSSWSVWVPGSPASEVLPAPVVAAGVLHSEGGLGTLLTTYQTGVPTGLPGGDRTTVVLRRVSSTSTSVVFTDQRAVATEVPDLGYGLSGTRTAIPDWSDGATHQELVLRDLQYVTGRVRLGNARVRAVSTSGPYTLFALGSVVAGTVQTSVRWTGPDGLTHLLTKAGTSAIAQDGVLSAYQTTDGWIWLRDDNAPPSATNPRKVARPAGTSAASRTYRIWLSSGRLVVDHLDYSTGTGVERLLVVDLVRRASRSVVRGHRACDAMTGRTLLCREYLSGRVVTLDTGARTLGFRAVAGATLPAGARSTSAAYVGRLLARASTIDAREGWPTTMTIAALPAANRDPSPTRVLGPWNPSTDLSGTSRQCYGWAPTWSFTDPVRAFAVTLRDPRGRVVRTWKGSSADGRIRGVWWCPTATTALGTYRWTLTGTNGYGAVRDVTGTTTATGTVRVRRMFPAKVTIGVPATVRAGSTVTVTGRLLRGDTRKPVAGRTITLWRSLSWTGWAQVASGVTNATGTVVWRVAMTRTMLYQVRYDGAPDLEYRASPRTLVTVLG